MADREYKRRNVHYTGRLIDGKVFDTTEGDALPALFVVRDLIMGWQIALQHPGFHPGTGKNRKALVFLVLLPVKQKEDVGHYCARN